jgi:hypothetical protein
MGKAPAAIKNGSRNFTHYHSLTGALTGGNVTTSRGLFDIEQQNLLESMCC